MTSHNQGVVSPWLVLGSEIPLWAGFLGAAFFAVKKNGTGNFRLDLGITWPNVSDVRLGTLAGFVGRIIPVAYLLLIDLLLHLTHTVNGIAPTIIGVQAQGISGWTVIIVLTVVGAPIVEEIFFRGLLQSVFNRRCGPTASLFITAVIFSFGHALGEGPFAPIILFPMAVVLGYLRMKTGRLSAGMIAHAEFNAIGLALVFLPIFH